MTRDQLVASFVRTPSFDKLLSPTNHVIIGARGSGKTALARMLAHDHLAAYARSGDALAREAVNSRRFVGLYVSTKAEWVGSLRSKPWSSPADKETFFRWRLNLASCAALLDAVVSCLDSYVPDEGERLECERSFVLQVAAAWEYDGLAPIVSITRLREWLEDTEYRRSNTATRAAVLTDPPHADADVGVVFDGELFGPLRRAIALFRRVVTMPTSTRWVLAIDEAEFLEEDHQRILNSHMRSDSQGLTFKIATTPYGHVTRETNTGASLRVEDDFEYVYIDQDRTEQEQYDFAESLYRKLISRDDARATLRTLLGPTILLESKSSLWTSGSAEMELLRRHATTSLMARANKLCASDPERFRNEIVRKVHGLLKLREAVSADVGHRNLTIYSGAKMFVRCADGNPRRLLRLLRAVAARAEDGAGNARSHVSPAAQTQTLIFYSADALHRTQNEPLIGAQLYEFLNRIGSYMQHRFHQGPFSGDVYSGVDTKQVNLTEREWAMIKTSVEMGLLVPAVNRNNPDTLPIKRGVFHLANILAPHFRLLPRRGRAIDLRGALMWAPSSADADGSQRGLFEP
jgi:hypothetical protein